MQLIAVIEDRNHPIEVPEELLAQAEGFFAKMDADMDGGWQMSRRWVDNPGTMERCQIAADKLREAIDTGNEELKVLMAGYILSRAPGVMTVRIDTAGDITDTELLRS